MQEVRAEIEAVSERWRQAVAEKDIAKLLGMMTDDIVLIGASGAPFIGKDALEAAYTGLFKQFEITNTASATDMSVELVGDLAVVSGWDSMIMKPLDGTRPTIHMRGPSMMMLRKDRQGWKFARGFSCMVPT